MVDLKIDETEHALIATVVAHPDYFLEIEGLGPDRFVTPAGRLIWAALTPAEGRLGLEQLVTVLSQTPAMGTIDALTVLGGREGLTTLLGRAHPAGDLPGLVEQVVAAATSRRFKQLLSASLSRPSGDPLAAVSLLQNELDQLANVPTGDQGDIGSAITAYVDAYRKAKLTPGQIQGTKTHWLDVDQRMLEGLRPSNFLVLAGATGESKSIFTSQLVTNVISKTQDDQTTLKAAIFSTEMRDRETVARWINARAGVDSDTIEKGLTNPDEDQRVLEATLWVDRVIRPGLFYYGAHGFDTIEDIGRITRSLVRKEGVGLIVVDYIQRIQTRHFREKRAEEIGDVTSQLKEIAMKNDIIVVAVSQITRGAGFLGGRPTIIDMADSSSIEKDADYIMGLWRPARHLNSVTIKRDWDNVAILDLLKGRFRKQSTVYLHFNGPQQRYDDLDYRTISHLQTKEVQEALASAAKTLRSPVRAT